MARAVGYGLSAFRGAMNVFFAFGVLLVVINAMLYAIDTNRPALDTNSLQESQALIYKTLNDPKNQETQAGRITTTIYRQTLCRLVGEACTNNPKDADVNFHSSLYGMVGSMIALPYTNPPASGVFWVQNTMERTGLVPNVFAAQGIGFSSLRPLLSLWMLFRNIAIALIVIAIILLGFMIIFRLRINPQTVVTMQNSIPRIFATLLLISFSFAIAGFMIDVMYLLSGVVVSILGGYQAPGQLAPYMTHERQLVLVTQSGIWRVFNEVFWNSKIVTLGYDLLSIAPSAVSWTIRAIPSAAVIIGMKQFDVTNKFLTGEMLSIRTWAAGAPETILAIITWLILLFVLPIISPIILGLIILITTSLVVFVRIILLVLKAYIRILLNVILAPVILLPNVIPGRNDFSHWIKALAADLAVFPTIMVLFMISGIIAIIPTDQGNFWTPPFLSSAVNPNSFRMILSIGILFLIPNIVASIRGIFGIQESRLGFGPGLFFGGLAGAAGGGAIGGIAKGALSHSLATRVGGMLPQKGFLRRGISRVRGKDLPGETEPTPS